MAKFAEAMRHWKRMCDTYTTEEAATCCKGCPMEDRECGAIYETGNADFDAIECAIMAWAAENPEPTYPTFYDWIESMMGDDRRSIVDDHDFAEWVTLNRIPADIAQKLGIKPKENV